MECKREWNREFIDKNLTQTFRKGPLKQHRRKVLMDRERGRLPAMQIFVEARIDQAKVTAERSQLHAQWVQIKKERKRLQTNYNPDTQTLDDLRAALRPLDLQLLDVDTQLKVLDQRLNRIYQILHGRDKPEARQFIMKCPGEGCRGFLSQAWKCGTCQKFFCHDCHAEKTGHKDEEHTCNAEAKATAAMIQNETKPCPKCGIRISKIDGCDQMWCIDCHTTFSWNSGQILNNTVVHNPHYYEYLRRQNNGVVPREAGDVPCGGLPNAWQFTRTVMDIAVLTTEQKNKILEMMRCLQDIQYVRLPAYPLRQNANANQEHDIQYLMKNLDEEAWGTALERTETNFERRREIGLILQTLMHVGAEKVAALQNGERKAKAKIALDLLKEMEDVRTYTNESLIQKGIQMGIIVPTITEEWKWANVKREVMKEKKKGATNTVVVPSAPPQAEQPQPVPEASAGAAGGAGAMAATAADNEEGLDEIITVDLGNGETMDMTLQQARQVFGVRLAE